MKMPFSKFTAAFMTLGLISISEVFSANIAIMVVETNIPHELKNNHAGIWESGIMDVFFAEGFIVSNARILRVVENDREDFPPEALDDFQKAIENGSDYFVLTTLKYAMQEDSKVPPDISNVSVKLFRITPYQFVVEKKLELDLKKGKTAQLDEIDKAQAAAKTLLPYFGSKT